MKSTVKTTIVLLFAVLSLNAQAQKWGKTPEDSAKCALNTYLYSEQYKIKDYIAAYEPWKEALTLCPGQSKNLYIRGVTIMTAKLNAAKSSAERDSLLEELFSLYDKRIANFGEAGVVFGQKAYKMEQLLGKKGVERYYPVYLSAVNSTPVTSPNYIYNFFLATLNYVAAGLADTTTIIDNYDLAITKLEEALHADPSKAEDINKYIANIENAFAPFASCEELVKIYSRKLEATPNDTNLLIKITKMLRSSNCTSSEVFFTATQNLHRLVPSASSALAMGQMCYTKGEYSDAVKYLNEALQGLSSDKDVYRCHILIGLSHDGSNSYSAARASYQRAASIDPTKGEPYLLIAQLYAKSARSIADDMGGASAYWAAVDKAVKARNIDSSPANVEAANKIISTYSAYFPKQERAFMLDLIDGQSFTVPGWIGETTTIRTRK